jgi:acyl-CoA reductase-like NAD-dependent aldehyde dehydrogenase
LRIVDSHPVEPKRAPASGAVVVDSAALDAAVADLRAGLPSWLALPLQERVALLRSTRRRVGEEAEGIVAAGCAAQGLAADGPWAGEHWAALAPVARHLKAFEEVLGRIAAGGEPVPAGSMRTRPDGQVVVDVFPATTLDRVLFTPWNLRGRLWMQPGVSAAEVRADAARAYRGAGFANPGVALVLGAGNFACLPGTDAVHMLLAQGCTVALKLNPVNAYLRPYLARAFADFVDRGWLRFVDESAQAGAYLARHPGIDRVHMTGSAATYDALVWGTGPEGARNREAGTSLLDKPFTAELGGVNPVIVVPGPWSAADLRRQADRIAFTKVFGCGHQCAASQVLVLPDGWQLSEALLDALRAHVRALPPRTPYYPGSQAKVQRALTGHASAEALSPPDRRWLVTDLDPAADDSLFRDEVFADVLGVVGLPALSVPAYLAAATAFANERLAGDLAASIYIHPTTAQQHADALDRAVAQLRFGTVAVNEFPNWGYMFGYPTWGGDPENTPQHVGSGIGTVGNAFLLDSPQKTVLTARFHSPIKPTGTASNRTMTAFSRGFLRYATTDDPRALPGVLAAALRA